MVGYQRPSELLVPELFGYGYCEHAPVAARQEMGWLALVRTAGFNVVIRPHRNVQLLFQITVEITKENAEAAVCVFEPAFKGGGHALAGVVEWFHRQMGLSRGGQRSQQ